MFYLLLELPYSLGKHSKTIAAIGYFVIWLSIVQLLSTAFAQAYAGTYIELENTNNELILTYEGDGLYTGVLFEGIGVYSVQASEIESTLKGLILKSRIETEQDVAFTAEFKTGQLLFTMNQVNSDGELDLDNQFEITYARPGTSSSNDSAESISESTSVESIQPLEQNVNTALTNLRILAGTLVGEVIQPDEQYWGGTQLQAPSVGISFQVPSAGTAIHSSPNQTVVIGHTSTLGNVSITALSTGDFTSFITSATSNLTIEEDQVLNPISQPIETQNSYQATYELKSESRSSYIEIAALTGPLGNMVLFIAKSRMQEAEDISQVLNMVLTSLVFAEPSEVNLEATIGNSRLSSENAFLTKGLLDICNNSEYRLENIDDAQDIQIGLWKPAASLFSSGVVLNSIDGDFNYLPLEGLTENKNNLTIEDSPYCQ